MTAAAFQTRALLHDVPAGLRLAAAASVHGFYVRNALERREGEGFLFGSEGRDQGLCWFGTRGNLVVIAATGTDPRRVADTIRIARLPWRIAMGPAFVVDALRDLCTKAPLVHRDQIYYLGEARAANRELAATVAVRSAEPMDRARLVQAALQLNEADLHIAPRRVDRPWLRDAIDERIAAGSCFVLGEPGAITCKLDIGSEGEAGRILEGVFTFPEARGRGQASALVAACLLDSPGKVGLHVAADNRPARAAYERAGMREVGRCRLLLLG